MAKLGRKAHHDRPVHWKIAVPESVASPIELILSDPMTGKPAHGARGQLITQLLREWLDKQRKTAIQPAPLDE